MELNLLKHDSVIRCNNIQYFVDNSDDKILKYDPYHCRNWTFTLHHIDEHCIQLADTYFSKILTITYDELKYFDLIMNRTEMKLISEDDVKRYNEKDIISCLMDSSAKHRYYVRKGTEYDLHAILSSLKAERRKRKKRIEVLDEEIAYYEGQLNRSDENAE